MIQRLRRRDEQGSALVVALAFLSLFGIFIAAILAQVSTNMRLTTTTRGRAAGLMAADGGIEWAVQEARTHDAVCKDDSTGPEELTSTLQVDGRTVTVSCVALAGEVDSPAAQQWAVIAKNGITMNAGADPRVIGGDVWAGGTLTVPSGGKIATEEADVIRGQATCAGFVLTGFAPPAPDVSSCSTAAAPDVTRHALPPTAPAGHAPAGTSTCGGNAWTIWHPGGYTSVAPPTEGSRIYMESGVYYFEDLELVLGGIGARIVVGGAPSPGDDTINAVGCTSINDTTLHAAGPSDANGSGVTIILGGNSSIRVPTSARVELYTRVPGNPAVEGTPGISIITAPTTANGYKAWTLPVAVAPLPSAAVNISATTGRAAVHGLVYAPTGPVFLYTNFTAPLLGGVVTSWLTTNIGGGGRKAVEVSGRRTLLLTSVAVSATPDEVSAVQYAVVKIANDPARTASVRSWRAQ